MDIIFLLNSPFPYYTGGRETWLYNVVQRLYQDHQIYILAETPWFYEENGRFPDLDERVHFLQAKDLRNSPIFRHVLHSYMNVFNEQIMLHSMWRQLSRLLRTMNGKPCFIISLDTVYTAQLGVKAKRKYSHVKYISSVRGRHADILSSNYPLLRTYFSKKELQTLSAADQIWSNGWDTQNTLRKKGFSSIVMKNGVDIHRAEQPLPVPSDLIPSKGTYFVLAIGTLQDKKGCRELIQAAGILKRKYNFMIGITFFGKGNPEKYLSLARKEGVEKQVRFSGVQLLTVEYASSFDLTACLSERGGLSMACLESLLSGTPVIAWDNPTYSQMITHGESGWLVTEKDSAALAEGIFWLSEHREAAQCMGKNAQKSVEKFDWSYIAQDIVDCLKEV